MAVADGAVLTRNQTILASGPRARVEQQASRDAFRAFFPNGTVLPGLIDSHVHLAFDASEHPVESLSESNDETLFEAMASRARRLLDLGVTTVRDLGDRAGLAIKLRNAIASGILPGPRILSAGAPITSEGGHCWFLGGEVEGIDEIRDHVRRARFNGADLIKVMATGGRLTPGGPPPWMPQFSERELHEIVTEARRYALPVAAHVHGTESIRSAVAAGVDTLEHCRWMTETGLDAPQAIVAEIVRKGIYICPTINSNWETLFARVGRSYGQDLLAIMARHHEDGVLYIGGSDAGIPGIDVGDYSRGLMSYTQIGLTEAEVIQAATVRAADALGMATQIGQIAPGLRADLLVVEGNPLRSLSALQSVLLVMIDGRLHITASTHIVSSRDAVPRPQP